MSDLHKLLAGLAEKKIVSANAAQELAQRHNNDPVALMLELQQNAPKRKDLIG